MKKYLKLSIFIMIIIFSPQVFAQEINITNKIKSSPTGSTGTYKATEIYNTGTTGTYSTGTRYNGRISYIEFYLDNNDWNYVEGSTYTISMSMATQDWRNNFMGPQIFRANTDGSVPSTATNMYVSNTFRFVSMYNIKFNIKVASVMGAYTKFVIYSSNVSTTAFTGVNNWNLSSIIISSNTATPTPPPVTTPTPTPTSTSNNQDIINNANQNTTDIINNNNNNTQSIIDNNTQNTSDIIENANNNTGIVNDSINSNCKTGPYSITKEWVVDDGQYLDSNTGQPTGTGFSTGITDYLIVNPDSDYTIIQPGGSPSAFLNVCLYGANKENLACYSLSTYSFVGTMHTSKYTQYIRIAYPYSWWYSLAIEGPICNDLTKQAQDKTNEKLDDINNSINNDNIDINSGNDFFSGFQNNMHGLSGIITIPLSYIQSLSSAQCSPLHIPIPFTNNKYLDLPCMSTIYQQYVPTLLTLIQTCWYGILAYKVLIDIFGIVKGFKDPDSDKIEVMDL